MMESMASITRERGEARRVAQAFRDLAALLFLLMLVLSVRFQSDEAAPAIQPLPDGVQAADQELAEPLDTEPAAAPALETSEPASRFEAAPVACLREFPHRVETRTRVLLLVDGEAVREIRIPARFPLPERKSGSSTQEVELQARS